MQRERLSAAQSTLFLTVIGVLSQVVGFCYRVILSRMVGAEVMGLYQLLMPISGVFLSLGASGLISAVSNLTPQYLALNNGKAVAQTVRLALRCFLVLILPVGAAVILFYDPISVYLLGDARTQLGLVLLIPCVVLTGIENLHKHVFYGADLVRPPAISDLVEQGVRMTAVFGLLLLFSPTYPERTAALIILGMVICEILSALSLRRQYKRRFSHLTSQGQGENPFILRRRVASIAIPVGLTAVLSNIINAANATLLPRLLVEHGSEQSQAIADFGIICGMTLPMLAFPTVLLSAMNLVLLPRLARSTALGRKDEISRLISNALQIVSVTMLPAMGLLSIIGSDLSVLLFQQPGTFLLPLAIATALNCYQSTFCVALNGTGKQSNTTLISIVCGIAQLVITLLSVPTYGMAGFVAANLITAIAGALLSAMLAVRHTGVHLRMFDWFSAPLLATVLMALTGRLLLLHLSAIGIGNIAALFATSIFCIVLYLSALQAQGVPLRTILHIQHKK